MEPLAHLAWAPPLLCAQARLHPVRSFQALSQRQSFLAHRSGAKAAGKDGFLAGRTCLHACRGLPALPISVLVVGRARTPCARSYWYVAKLLERSGRDSQDRAPIENARNRRCCSAGRRRFDRRSIGGSAAKKPAENRSRRKRQAGSHRIEPAHCCNRSQRS